MTRRARPVGLMQFIPKLSPRFHEPRHLAPFVEVFEAIRRGEEKHAVCSVPPRHEKTETTKHALAWLLLDNPALRVGYVTYSQTFSEKKSREIRELYQRAGGALDGNASSRRDWRTGVNDGGVWATSIGGPITGEGFDVLVFDDLVKDRATAESAVEREKLWDWYRDTAFTRLEPSGSEVAIGTRWHVDDIGGRLLSEGREGIILPALDGHGRALCPQRYNVSQLQKIKETIGTYGWCSLYMCQPFARGGVVFRDAYYYNELPSVPLRVRIGADFAYSTKSRADHSVAVVLGEHQGLFYVLDVVRMQTTAPVFLSRLQALQARYGGARVCAYIGGQEGGVIDTMQAFAPGGLKIDAKRATTDKFTRAQPVSAAWNAGKLLLPRSAPWLDAFVAEIVGFTGQGDRSDDQVDALASAFDAAAKLARKSAGVRAPRPDISFGSRDERPIEQSYAGSVDGGRVNIHRAPRPAAFAAIEASGEFIPEHPDTPGMRAMADAGWLTPSEHTTSTSAVNDRRR